MSAIGGTFVLMMIARKKLMMEDKFYAKKCNFQGTAGYMLSQFHNGEIVCTQFIPEEIFNEYCKIAKVNPQIIDRYQDLNVFTMNMP